MPLTCGASAAGGRLNAAELLVVDQRGHGRMGAAYRAIRVLAQLQLAETHAQRIHQQQAPDQRIALRPGSA